MTSPFLYSFGTIAFHPVVSEAQPLVSVPILNYTVRHIPYSNFNVLDIGGNSERRYATKIRVDSDATLDIELLLGTTNVLVVANVTWPVATLVALTNHTMTPRGEYHMYDAEWVVG